MKVCTPFPHGHVGSKPSDKTAVNLTISLGPDASSPSTGTTFHSSEAFNKHSRTSLITYCACFPITVHPFLSTARSCAKSLKRWPVSSSILTPARAVIFINSLGLPVPVLFRASCYFLKASVLPPSPFLIAENFTGPQVRCTFPVLLASLIPWTFPFPGMPSNLSFPLGNGNSTLISLSYLSVVMWGADRAYIWVSCWPFPGQDVDA